MSITANYFTWNKRFREYTGQGHSMVLAWNLANRDFGMNAEDTESYLKSIDIPIELG